MPLINQNIGLIKMAELYGLKRRFFGLESKRSLAARVLVEIRKQNFTALADAETRDLRHCVQEGYQEIETPPYYLDNGNAVELPGPMELLKVWTFDYNDGTSEQVISREYL